MFVINIRYFEPSKFENFLEVFLGSICDQFVVEIYYVVLLHSDDFKSYFYSVKRLFDEIQKGFWDFLLLSFGVKLICEFKDWIFQFDCI